MAAPAGASRPWATDPACRLLFAPLDTIAPLAWDGRARRSAVAALAPAGRTPSRLREAAPDRPTVALRALRDLGPPCRHPPNSMPPSRGRASSQRHATPGIRASLRMGLDSTERVPSLAARSQAIPRRSTSTAAGSSSPTFPAWLQRTHLLIDTEGIAALQSSRVLLVGLGGVGSFAAEFLVR